MTFKLSVYDPVRCIIAGVYDRVSYCLIAFGKKRRGGRGGQGEREGEREEGEKKEGKTDITLRAWPQAPSALFSLVSCPHLSAVPQIMLMCFPPLRSSEHSCATSSQSSASEHWQGPSIQNMSFLFFGSCILDLNY